MVKKTDGIAYLPQIKEQEKLVLTQLYLSEGEYFSIIDRKGITGEHFHLVAHRDLFTALKKVYDTYDVISIASIRDFFSNDEAKAETVINTLQDLQHKVTNNQVSEAVFETYLDNLVANRFRQQLVEYANKYLIDELVIKRTDAKIDELLDSALRHLAKLGLNLTTSARSTQDIVIDLINHLQDRFISNKQFFFTTGITPLDDLTQGFNNAELNIIAARPSQGKTALAVQMTHYLQTHFKTPTGFISYEQPEADIMIRFASHSTLKSFYELTRDKKTCYENFIAEMDKIFPPDLQLYFIPPAESLKLLLLSIQRAMELHNLKVIIIDYLQLMSYDNNRHNETRNAELSKITRELKQFALKYKTCIILLSQLNRNIDNREGDKAKPRLSDLRDSGAIEQDADKVLFIHRPDATKPKDLPYDDATFILAKNRNGAVGEVSCRFNRRLMRFEN